MVAFYQGPIVSTHELYAVGGRGSVLGKAQMIDQSLGRPLASYIVHHK